MEDAVRRHTRCWRSNNSERKMISRENIPEGLKDYDADSIMIGALGGHSALDICAGAKKQGFKTVVVCQKGREKTYGHYFKSGGGKGIVDNVIILEKFSD